MGALQLVTTLLRQLFQSRAALAAENLALHQQVAVLQRSVKRSGRKARRRTPASQSELPIHRPSVRQSVCLASHRDDLFDRDKGE
jgi:hypothetical protein